MSRSRRLLLFLLAVGCVYLFLQGTDRLPYVAVPSSAPKVESKFLARHFALTEVVFGPGADIQAAIPTTSQGVPVLKADSQEVLIATQPQTTSDRNRKTDSSKPDTPPVETILPQDKQTLREVVEKLEQLPANNNSSQSNEKKFAPKNDLQPPKSILSPEQLLQIMGSAISNLPVQNPKKVTHVLITTYFRSGSTFLGDILQQNWKTFYHFEPLHHLSDGVRLKDAQVPEALSLLPDLMRCNFSSPLAEKYLLWASDQKNTFLIRRNRFLWVSCRMQPQLCFRPDFVRFICVRAPWQVMKVNRLSLKQAGQIALDNPDLDIRVLHLVRDPRGIISSRKVLPWCNTTSCSDFRVLCNEMSEDFEEFQRLRRLRPDRFFELRYEDLSMKPEEVSQQLLGSLNVPFTNTVSKFLRLNTKAKPLDARDPYSTKRDSRRTPFEWRKKLRMNEVKKMQIGCASVLRNYDYTFVNSSKQLVGNPKFLYSSEKPWIRI